MLKSKLIYPEDSKSQMEYSQFVDNVEESYFQQTLEWGKVITTVGQDALVIASVEEDGEMVGAIPCYIFHSSLGNIINSIPYPGPLGGVVIGVRNQKKKREIFRLLMDSVNRLAADNHCILAAIISSPFWPDDNLYREYFQPDYELKNYTLYIDFTHPLIINSHFRNNKKRMLKKAASLNLYVRESYQKEDILEWYEIHFIRHKQLGLEPVDKNIFLASLEYLVNLDKGKFFLVFDEEEIIAGCFVAYHQQVMDTYMISGYDEAYGNGAIYLLIEHILNWAEKRGFKFFNWQSSKPRGGGPYNFKMQWGSKEAAYFFFVKTYRPLDKFLQLSLDDIKKTYRWHFVLPYNLFH